MRVRVDYPVDGVVVYNLAAWSHMVVDRYGPTPGVLTIHLPAIPLVVRFADTSADNPINEEAAVNAIDRAQPGDGIFSMEEFETLYREELARLAHRSI